MIELKYTLLADGPSDDALLPILTWLLRVNGVRIPIQPSMADLRGFALKDNRLPSRIKAALEFFPCELLFVHRDAEKEPLNVRKLEILEALNTMPASVILPAVVCVVPVRMTEAWLLFHEPAIRRAAGNPNGRTALDLPNLGRIEDLVDPKEELYNCLRLASGFQGRRLKQFSAIGSARRVAGLIDEFAQLRRLSAFEVLENEIKEIVQSNGW